MLDPRDITKGGTFIVSDITEKKAMSEALRRSEAKYRDLLANTQTIIVRMDLQGTITFFNTYALAFFDYASEDVIGKNVVGTIVSQKSRSGHDLSMVADDLGFNADGYAVNVSENIRRNGDRVWIAWINKAIRDEKGHIVEILCIGNDITDRKRDGIVRISTDTWKDLVVTDTDVADSVFDAVFHICTEISIEGREGKAVGTTFLIGDVKNVLEKSRQIILNPFEGHPPDSRIITNPGLKENIKALAQLDGAFVITGDGFVESVGRYITVDSIMVALIISSLAARLRYQARIATYRERRTNALFDLGKELAGALTTAQIIDIGCRHLRGEFRAHVAFLLPDARDQVQPARAGEAADCLRAPDIGVAQWVYDHEEPAGLGTNTLPASPALYLPLRAPMRTRGVLALAPADPQLVALPEQYRLLETFAAQIALALERVHYVEVAQDALVSMESERLRNALLSTCPTTCAHR